MFSIIFQREGLTDWWKPNQTSRPPPRGLEQPSEGVKKERPTGVYLGGARETCTAVRLQDKTTTLNFIAVNVKFDICALQDLHVNLHCTSIWWNMVKFTKIPKPYPRQYKHFHHKSQIRAVHSTAFVCLNYNYTMSVV